MQQPKLHSNNKPLPVLQVPLPLRHLVKLRHHLQVLARRSHLAAHLELVDTML